MRSNRPFAAATPRESHARALHARANSLARAWTARARASQPAAAPDNRLERIVAQRLRNAPQ
eukprot:5325903-Lingulodinium_polyedra.AAC.1